jgi:MATE family multidrug resistance protein
LGLPISFQISFEMAAFGFSTLMAGKLGTVATSAHLVVLNMASITFMVPLGIGLAASTRIGNLIGEGRPLAARRSARLAFATGGGVMLLAGTVFYLGRELLPNLYTKPEDLEVRALAAIILPIAAAFQVFDGLQVVGSGILRGVGKTRPAAIFNLIGFWPLALPLGWYLAFPGHMGLAGIWWGLLLGLACVASGLMIYWKRLDVEHIARV